MSSGNMTSPWKIGVIGVGEMGAPMARRLRAAGHEVRVCDARQQAVAALRDEGFDGVERPCELKAADAVIVMVGSDPQIEAALCGGGESLAAGLAPDHAPLVLVTSTCLPRTMFALRERMPPAARLIDAPVSGGLIGATNGSLSIMLGGADADIDAALPVLETVGRNLFRCGGLGAGQMAKLINNMIGLTNLYLVSEGFEIARRSGMDLGRLAEALDASAGRTYLTKNMATSRSQFATWARSREAYDALSGIVRKDIVSALTLAGDAGVDAPVLRGVAPLLGQAQDAVFERWRALAATEDAAAATSA